jgi:hypothetical protein
MDMRINSFEYEFLKASAVIQELAKETNKTVREIIKANCIIEEEEKSE